MQLHVDQSRCQGHARCNAIAPEAFALDDDGYVATQSGQVPGHLAEDTQRGVKACPEQALSLIDV